MVHIDMDWGNFWKEGTDLSRHIDLVLGLNIKGESKIITG